MIKKSIKFILLISLTFLSFIEGFAYEINQKEIPDSLFGDDLKLALYHTIKDHKSLSYHQIWQAFKKTDKKNDSLVWDIYSQSGFSYTKKDQCGRYKHEGDCFNREHSFPKDWWGGKKNETYTDLYHIYPTDGYVNNRRSNYPYGEVDLNQGFFTSKNGSKLGSSKMSCYSGVVFEPADEYKGDLTRSYFYIVTRYMTEIDEDWKTPVLEGNNFSECFGKLFTKWHEQDPVSQKEIDRNKAIEQIQHNTNPYISYPALVPRVWNSY